jgi:hypothetical protein
LWEWSGWKADQRAVDAVLQVVDRYAAGHSATPEPPSAVPEQRTRYAVPLNGYLDTDGLLWVRVGNVPDHAEPVETRTRKCNLCGGVKPLTRYRKDRKSRGGRKARCMDCDNTKRRNQAAANREARA